MGPTKLLDLIMRRRLELRWKRPDRHDRSNNLAASLTIAGAELKMLYTL